MLRFIKNGDVHPLYYGTPKETLSAIFTELLTGYTIIKDQKFLPVLGKSLKKAKPNLVEGRRSGRFHKNLGANLVALFQIDEVIGRYLPQPTYKKLQIQKKQLLSLYGDMGDLATGVYDVEQRKIITAFIRALSAYRNEMAKVYTKHLGITLGFNSLDGD